MAAEWITETWPLKLRERPISQQALAKYRSKIKQVLERHFDVQAQVLPAG
jgi:hypothetical protein